MYCTTPSGTRYHTGSPRIVRRRQSVELIASAGTSTMVTRSWGIFASVSASITKPGRVQPTNCASENRSSASRQVKMSARASAPVMKYRSASGRCSWRSRRVSAVYVGPPRSMSTRDTQNRGLDAVAITVIRYRCSAGVTRRSDFCQGSPVGTNTTSSSSNHACTSEAATRWPWWIGSNVPPITPMRGARGLTRASPCAHRGSAVLAPGAEDQQRQQRQQEDDEDGAPDDPVVDDERADHG